MFELLKRNNIMVDLETMGNNSKSAIVAIGAVRFGKTITDEFYKIVDLRSSLDVGLQVDADTILWWLKQSNEARGEFDKPSLTLPTALLDFSTWVGADPLVWGNGAPFDNVVLSNAYDACEINRPWHYSADRCYRTVKDMYPNIKKSPRIGTHHNALDDAINQANHLIDILTRA